jgi:hypothetical protein
MRTRADGGNSRRGSVRHLSGAGRLRYRLALTNPIGALISTDWPADELGADDLRVFDTTVPVSPADDAESTSWSDSLRSQECRRYTGELAFARPGSLAFPPGWHRIFSNGRTAMSGGCDVATT